MKIAILDLETTGFDPRDAGRVWTGEKSCEKPCCPDYDCLYGSWDHIHCRGCGRICPEADRDG